MSNNLFREVFQNAEEDGKAYLTKADLKVCFLELYGYIPTKYEIRKLLDAGDVVYGRDKKGISLPRFQELMRTRLAKPENADLDYIRQTFLAFDRHSNHFLRVEDLVNAAKLHNLRFSGDIWLTVFHEADSDGDGRISYSEFEALMKKNRR